MTQPVTRNEWPVDFVGPPPPPALPIEPVTRGIEDLPTPAQRSVVRLAPQPAASAEPPVDASAAGRALDEYLLRFTPTFRTPEGQVAVPIGFHMNSPGGAQPPSNIVLQRIVSQTDLSPADQQLVLVGKGSPEAIARVTQALIDAGYLPPADDHGNTGLGARVRQMTITWRVGVDCAGYVAPALLALRGVTPSHAGFPKPAQENLGDLASRGYVAVPDGAPWKTGDVVVMHSTGERDPGHRAIVRDAGPVSAAELQRLNTFSGLPSLPGEDTWEKIVVDSSWGGGAGAQRRTWWHDKTQGAWVYATTDGTLWSSTGPYGHPSFQVFRFAGSR